MRLATAWHRKSRVRLILAATLAAVALVGCVLTLSRAGNSPARAAAGPAVDVPADELQMINSAARSCPTLTPPRLAAQIMANSGFDAQTHDGDRQGIAGLTDAAWKQWAPGPAAQRGGVRDNIDALAHLMCDLIGHLRSQAVSGDPWHLSLASFLVGLPTVVQLGSVPAGAAGDYVRQVDSYAAWYSGLPQFGGPVTAASPPSTATVGKPPSAQPTHPPTPASAPPTNRAGQAGSPNKPGQAGSTDHTVPGTRSAYTTIQAESYSDQSGTVTEACIDAGGGSDVGKMANEDWLRYNALDFGSTGATSLRVRFASDLPTDMSGWVELRVDSLSASPVTSIPVRNTGGWQNWVTLSANMPRLTGPHTVFITSYNASDWEIGNVNWISFQH